MDRKVTRRVYRPELEQRTGFGTTWLRNLEKAGKIPKGRVDAGGKRKWWTDEEADAIVAGQPVGAPEKQAA
jgi:hypothetical protein